MSKCGARWHLRPAPLGPLLCGLDEGHEGYHGEWVEVGEYLAPGLGPGMRPRPPSEDDLDRARVRRKVTEAKLEREEGQLGLGVFV